MGLSKTPQVGLMTKALRVLLHEARRAKPTDGIGAALTATELARLIERNKGLSILAPKRQDDQDVSRQTHFARIETAVRSVFNTLLSSTSIEQQAFVEMWDLLDAVSVFSDLEQCEPGLIFWLVEELLDSQTIDGCKKVFDYLESRRERLTARHFKQKNLIILRSCNELLRRLSRAENTVFCGRVFIFLFQSFPLGDKSSVNLRGEYHVQNITSFEDSEVQVQNTTSQGPETQGKSKGDDDVAMGGGVSPIAGAISEKTAVEANGGANETVSTDGKQTPLSQHVDYDRLYPIFWSLQTYFSNPPLLFDSDHLQKFKTGIEMTLAGFRELNKNISSPATLKALEDSRRGVKRKRGEGDEHVGSNFNPKYLTSRDLFKLEISDLAFRRHILVQALILIDFLLSLTPKEKAKLAELNLQNKSVQYQYTLGDDDAKWAMDAKSEMAGYLQQGPEGKFYYRMVDTVLSRDKHWVRWKAESCPAIERAPISAQQWIEARDTAEKACISRKMRTIPLGSLDLGFLSDDHHAQAWEQLKDPQRFAAPEAESFRDLIAEAQEKIENARDEEEKEQAVDEKASGTWRALRLASKTRLTLFDMLDNDANNLQPLYELNGPSPGPAQVDSVEA